ncbi:hypothetical protein ACI7BZ_08190 [Xanthobacter sp. AM11]|uniref:hypothetical protein n=1 Tax=Xanthobacter sp. AM11 TaxID=3380643 RepID=UPI0039BF870B
MKTSSLIVMAGATLVAATTIGAGLVRAFPAGTSATTFASPATTAEKPPYLWRGLWDSAAATPAAYGPDCPLRKVWMDTPDGPRLKWRRTCARPD